MFQLIYDTQQFIKKKKNGKKNNRLKYDVMLFLFLQKKIIKDFFL